MIGYALFCFATLALGGAAVGAALRAIPFLRPRISALRVAALLVAAVAGFLLLSPWLPGPLGRVPDWLHPYGGVGCRRPRVDLLAEVLLPAGIVLVALVVAMRSVRAPQATAREDGSPPSVE